MQRLGLAVGLSLALAGTAAHADEYYGGRSQGWSMQSGQTMGDGNTAVSLEAGWPGVPVTLLHGVAPNVDLGGRFTFNYGYEGITEDIIPGIKLQGILRLKLADTGKVNFGMSFEPGPLFYFPGGGAPAIVGLAIPIDFVVGIPVASNFMVNAGMGFPMWVTFGNYSSFNFPISFGGGFEYFIDSHLAVTFNLRMGPVISSTPYAPGSSAVFALQKALFGVEFKI